MPTSGEDQSLPDDHAQHVAALRAERHPDADFLRALRHAVGDDAVDADGREQQRRAGENAEQQHRQTPLGDRARDDLVHRPDVGDGELGSSCAHDADD